MSASRTPTRLPCSERATARAAVTVDLPTPPLPEQTASTRVAAASDLILEAVSQRAARDGQRDRHRNAPVLDLDFAHHVELRHGTAQLGVDHTAEGFENGFAARHLVSVALPASARRAPADADARGPAQTGRRASRTDR